MAHTKQAKKRIRQNEAHRARNRSVRSEVRTQIRAFMAHVASGDKAAATEQIRSVESGLDRASKRGVMHRRTASRVKSKLKSKLAALA